MNRESISRLPLPGSRIRIVYSAEGLEMFAIGILIGSGDGHITIRQYADQYGPVEPYQLIVQWSAIIRLTVDGPAADRFKSLWRT
jgi:hypothetical protein